MTNDGVWVFSTTIRLAMFKAWEPKAKLLRSSWNWNLVKPNLSSFGIPPCKISRTALTLGWSNFCVMAPLRMSRRSGQSELKSWVHLTEGIAHFVTWMVANGWINWHLTVAKCAVPSGLSHRLCCNNRAVRIIESVLLAVSIAPKGTLLMLQWHRIRILQSHRRPVIQYNVGQTWGLLTAPLSEFASVWSWFIWVHST